MTLQDQTLADDKLRAEIVKIKAETAKLTAETTLIKQKMLAQTMKSVPLTWRVLANVGLSFFLSAVVTGLVVGAFSPLGF